MRGRFPFLDEEAAILQVRESDQISDSPAPPQMSLTVPMYWLFRPRDTLKRGVRRFYFLSRQLSTFAPALLVKKPGNP